MINILVIDSVNDFFRYVVYLYDSNPIIFILGFFFITIILIIIAKLIEIYLKTHSDKIIEEVEGSDKVAILMHENPDPDAMASALGIQHIINSIDKETEIFYAGNISHHENRAFRAVLDVSFTNIKDKDEITGDKIILVDHHEARGFSNAEDVEPDIIIDHHSKSIGFNEEDVGVCYIDSSYGSCSTIVYEFMMEQGFVIGDENNRKNINSKIATGLYYGIMSDTDNLIRSVSKKDYYASMNLYEGIEKDDLYRISNPKIDEDSLDTKANAILNRTVRGPFAVSYIDGVSNSDAIPQAADTLVKLEGLSSVVVIGSCDEKIRLSGRAYDDRVHMGDVISCVLENIDGASGGGHSKMGGGIIPKNKMEDELNISELTEDIFSVLNGDIEV